MAAEWISGPQGKWPMIVTNIAKVTVLLAAVAAIAVGVGFAVDNTFSEEPDPVAHLDRLTPLPGPPGTASPPDTSKPVECRLEDQERPAPDLPPLPCKRSSVPPPPLPIPSGSGSPQMYDPGPGRRLIDNPGYRFTIEVIDGWYVSMRPSGGEFSLFDPVMLEQEKIGANLPGGANIHFFAEEYKSLEELGYGPEVSEVFIPVPHRHLERAPHNAQFGSISGAVWEEPGEEGLARVIYAAFVRDGILFTIRVNLGLGTTAAQTQADADAALAMITTITPY